MSNTVALEALKKIVASWDARTFEREKYVPPDPAEGDLGAVGYWTPSSSMVDAEAIANARAAIAALEAQPTGWMPIESAPKDKVLLLGYFNAAGKWAACAHEFKSSTVANCLTRYTCTKCGKAHAPTATQGQDAAPAEQPQDDEPTWQELEDFRKRHWTHWNAADNLLIAHLAQKLKCAARAKE